MEQSFEQITGLRAALVSAPSAPDPFVRALLRLSGRDRTHFLNGMVTNDVALLAPGDFCDALMVTRKGRVQSVLEILALDEVLLIDASPGTGTLVREVLEKHIIADDVQVEDLSQAWASLDIEGPDVPELLRDRIDPPPDLGHFSAGPQGLLFMRRRGTTAEGFRVWGERSAILALESALALPLLDASVRDHLRIARFVPRLGVDFTDANFPQEARLDGGISYSKGCYLGQEIIARIHSRGAVNRLLVLLHVDGPIQPGAQVQHGSRGVGSITSAAEEGATPAQGAPGAWLALGYVARECARPGTELAVSGHAARVLGPDL